MCTVSSNSMFAKLIVLLDSDFFQHEYNQGTNNLKHITQVKKLMDFILIFFFNSSVLIQLGTTLITLKLTIPFHFRK